MPTLQVTNPDGLLRLYLLYDLIPQAVELTIEYIEGVIGQGSQHFGIKVLLLHLGLYSCTCTMTNSN